MSSDDDDDDFHGGLKYYLDQEEPWLYTGRVMVMREDIDDVCVFSLNANSTGNDLYEVRFLCQARRMGMNSRFCGLRYSHNNSRTEEQTEEEEEKTNTMVVTIDLLGCDDDETNIHPKNGGGTLSAVVEDRVVPEVVTIRPPNVDERQERLFELFATSRVASHLVQLAIVAGGEQGRQRQQPQQQPVEEEASSSTFRMMMIPPSCAILNGLAIWILKFVHVRRLSRTAWRNGGDFSTDVQRANAKFQQSIQQQQQQQQQPQQQQQQQQQPQDEEKDPNRRTLVARNTNMNSSFEKHVVQPAMTAEHAGNNQERNLGIAINDVVYKCDNSCYGGCGVGCICWFWICGDCTAYRGCWEHDCFCSCIVLWHPRCSSFMAHSKTCSIPGCAANYCEKENVVESC